MAGYVIVGTLAAFGLLSLLWAVFGVLLPGGEGCAVVCFGQPRLEIFAVFKWLKGLGILKCPLIAVTEEENRYFDETERCSPEDLLSRLIEERNRFDGTGNGDHPGRGKRRGISEL